MFIYVDSSVLVSILFGEPSANHYSKILSKADDVMSHHLLMAEVLSTAARENISLNQITTSLDSISLVYPDRSLLQETTRCLEAGYLRGADLLHVATACYLDPDGADIRFLSADIKQKNLAKKIGLRVT